MTKQELLEKNLKQYTAWIKDGSQFAHVKLGDTEIYSMRGAVPFFKIDGNGQHFASKYTAMVKNAVISLIAKPNVYFPDWFYSNPEECANYQFMLRLRKQYSEMKFIEPFELIMAGWGNLEYPYLLEFYQAIQESGRDKIYLSNDKNRKLIDILRVSKWVEVPERDAIGSYGRIWEQTRPLLTDNAIVMLSVGLMSPVIANDILEANPTTTILDIGSGLDPLAGRFNRGYPQATVKEAEDYFKQLIL